MVDAVFVAVTSCMGKMVLDVVACSCARCHRQEVLWDVASSKAIYSLVKHGQSSHKTMFLQGSPLEFLHQNQTGDAGLISV